MSLDTHELVKELTSVGFTEPQAEALTHAIGQLATKDDLEELKDAGRADLEQAVQRIEHKFDLLRRDMELMRRDLVIWLGSMIVAATGVLLAARFFGHG